MRKTIIGVTALVAGVFGVGYAVGQIGGVAQSSAATTVTTPNTTAPTQGFPGPGDMGGFHSGMGGFHGGMGGPHADGTVTAVNGDTITIAAGTDPAGTDEYTGVTTVLLTASTQYDGDHDSTTTMTKSSIKVGSYIIVNGTVSSDGKSITATSVGMHPGGPVPGR